ncbi:MAG TPA: Usg family protein [Stellaceae bacterium]|nr:Usg family protein [Stellaceae bacterium]
MLSQQMLRRQLEGYRLTTAEILYHLPDHPHLVQSFVWQQLDIAPQFPELHRFLDFWKHNIEGKLHSVQVAHATLIGPAKLRHAQVSLSLH